MVGGTGACINYSCDNHRNHGRVGLETITSLVMKLQKQEHDGNLSSVIPSFLPMPFE